MKQFSTARNKNDEIFQCYLQAYEEYKARIQASFLEQEEKFHKNELRKEELIKEHEENIFKYNEEYKARISAMRQSHIKAEEKEYKARSFHKEVMDEMKKAFQVQEQGPEQEQGTTVAERMAAHYKEQEEKFYKNELRKKVADLRRIQEHEKHILKFNEEFVARIEAMRQSHINYIEKEYKARIEVMDEMKKAFQVRRDGEGSDSRSSGSA